METGRWTRVGSRIFWSRIKRVRFAKSIFIGRFWACMICGLHENVHSKAIATVEWQWSKPNEYKHIKRHAVFALLCFNPAVSNIPESPAKTRVIRVLKSLAFLFDFPCVYSCATRCIYCRLFDSFIPRSYWNWPVRLGRSLRTQPFCCHITLGVASYHLDFAEVKSAGFYTTTYHGGKHLLRPSIEERDAYSRSWYLDTSGVWGYSRPVHLVLYGRMFKLGHSSELFILFYRNSYSLTTGIKVHLSTDGIALSKNKTFSNHIRWNRTGTPV